MLFPEIPAAFTEYRDADYVPLSHADRVGKRNPGVRELLDALEYSERKLSQKESLVTGGVTGLGVGFLLFSIPDFVNFGGIGMTAFYGALVGKEVRKIIQTGFKSIINRGRQRWVNSTFIF